MKKTLKAILKTMELIFIVFCLFVASLFFRQQSLPSSWVEGYIEDQLPDNFVCSCESLSFGFGQGLVIGKLRVFDSERQDSVQPILTAESVSILPFSRKVVIVEGRYPRLPDAYYADAPAEKTSEADDVGLDLTALAEIPSFTLEMIRPNVLGIEPEYFTGRIEVGSDKVELLNAHLDWPDQDVKMGADACCVIDLGAKTIVGEVRGTARQANIRPLMTALDLQMVYPYYGGFADTGTKGFTGVTEPVPAACAWRVNLENFKLDLDLDLHPVNGRYNNVRFQRADGKVGVHVYNDGVNHGFDITIGPLTALDPQGRKLEGRMGVHGTNDFVFLDFDARSDFQKQDLLEVIGYLNDGVFDDYRCVTPPRVSVKGVYNLDEENIPNNDLSGRVEVDELGYINQDLSKVAIGFHIVGGDIIYDGLTAKGVSGGDITGDGRFHLPLKEGEEEAFGSGSLNISNGKLVRVPLFLVLTSALADNVPGIEKLVNQSEARCDYTLSNGVFRTENLVVQGSLFCMRLKGSCDLATNELDFIAHCTILKDESILGRYFIQPVLWPFTKLLTEFHVTGSCETPHLENTSVKTFSETVGGWTSRTGEMIKQVFD